MSYFEDVYKKRAEWWGSDPNSFYKNVGIKYFEDYLRSSPLAEKITLNGEVISSAIHSNSENESKSTKIFLISLDKSVSIGDLIEWQKDNWIVIQKEQLPLESYIKVVGLKCNYELKWVDAYGVLNSTHAYVLGSMDSAIREVFKKAQKIAVSEDNKLIEAVAPMVPILTGQRFLLQGEAWRVTERDLISVNGILYISLTKEKVDRFDDDVENSVANADKIGTSFIDIGFDSLNLEINKTFVISPILVKSGRIIRDAEFTIASKSGNKIEGNRITATKIGTDLVIVKLKEQEGLSVSFTLVVEEEQITDPVKIQISGDSNIKWGRTRTYTAIAISEHQPTEAFASFEIISGNNLAKIIKYTPQTCTIAANDENLSGKIVLEARTSLGITTKEIEVVSIW